MRRGDMGHSLTEVPHCKPFVEFYYKQAELPSNQNQDTGILRVATSIAASARVAIASSIRRDHVELRNGHDVDSDGEKTFETLRVESREHETCQPYTDHT